MNPMVDLPLSSLRVSKVNVRKHIGDLSELKESIKKYGVLQPIIVRSVENGYYEIIAGLRRVTASQELKLQTIPAVIQDVVNGEAIIISLTENIQRGNLDIDEEGEAYEHLCRAYGSVNEVAAKINKSSSHIRRVLDALEAQRRLQMFSRHTEEPVPSIATRPTRDDREQGRALPSRHASELQAAFLIVQNDIPEDERDRKFVELAKIIARYTREETTRILREFKLHPRDSLDEIVQRALTPSEVKARLSLVTARQLDKMIRDKKTRPDDVVESAIRTYLTAQQIVQDVQSSTLAPQDLGTESAIPQQFSLPTPLQKPDDVIRDALDIYARQKQQEAQSRQQQLLARQHAREESKAIPAIRRFPSQKANDLDGAAWIRYSISIWNDIRKDANELALNHPAMFPSMLAARLIQCFTTADEKVILDPMAGVGSTVVAAKRLGKIGIGVELSKEYASIARARLEKTEGNGQGVIYTGDANHLLDFVDTGTVDFGVTSPPYWDILAQRRTADGKPVRDYIQAEGNVGDVADYREFLNTLKGVYGLVYQTLKPGAYFCVVVMDIRKKNRLYPFHSDLAETMQGIGFVYDDLIIWDRRQEYNNLRPLGYPSVFRINRIHEYVLIFKKPDKSGK